MSETTENNQGHATPGAEPRAEDGARLNSAEGRARLIARVKNILLKPKTEWEVIDREPASVSAIYMRHVLPLAAIPPLATLIGAVLFGYSFLGITYRPPLVGSLVSALVQYGLTLAGVFVLALVIEKLAPKFEASADRVQAFKVAAYSATASWVAGIFGLIPSLSILTILGLYSLYLLYLGLPRLMRAPQEKALSYTVVVVVVMVVIGLVIGALTAPIARQFGGGTPGAGALAGAAGGSGELTIPGVGSLDMGELERAQASIAQMNDPAAGPPEAIDPAVLSAMLPDSLAGLALTERESSSVAAAGVGGTRAQARYGEGERSISLEVTDMAVLGGLGALAGALNVESSRETATGYERTGRVDGRMTNEKWDSSTGRGSYGVLVGNRVMVEAEGRGVEIDDLKSAVHGLDLASLERAAGSR